MNIIETHKKEDILEVKVQGAFNLNVRNHIESRLSPEIVKLRINLSQSRIVDTEAIIFLHQWQKNGKDLELVNPPAILFEILDILELNEVWDLDTITAK